MSRTKRRCLSAPTCTGRSSTRRFGTSSSTPCRINTTVWKNCSLSPATRATGKAPVHALAEGDATSAMLDAMFAPKGAHAPDLPDSVMDLAECAVERRGRTGARDHQTLWSSRRTWTAFSSSMHCGAVAAGQRWIRLGGGYRPALSKSFISTNTTANEGSLVLPALAPPSPALVHPTYSDIYGEETLRVLFEEWMPARAAHEAAAGWGGDRVTSFSDGAVTAVAWTIRYDNDAAAVRGLHAFARGALAAEDQVTDQRGRLSEFVSATEAERATQSGQVCRERHTRGPFAVLRRGRDLIVTLGPFRRNSGFCGVRRELRRCAEVGRRSSRALKSLK